jgi:Zn-dependent protease
LNIEGPLLKLIHYGLTIDTVLSFFAVAVIIFVVFPIHECAHGFMADFLGDSTPSREGRLTLNPLVHIDPVGALTMLLFPIGWAKPIYTTPAYCTKVSARTASVLIAAAGPASNIAVAYIFTIIQKIVLYSSVTDGLISETSFYIAQGLSYVVTINVFLAILNLLPMPGFDGYKIIQPLLSTRFQYAVMQNQNTINVIFMVIFFATPIVGLILTPICNVVINGLDFLSGFVRLFFRI